MGEIFVESEMHRNSLNVKAKLTILYVNWNGLGRAYYVDLHGELLLPIKQYEYTIPIAITYKESFKKDTQFAIFDYSGFLCRPRFFKFLLRYNDSIMIELFLI